MDTSSPPILPNDVQNESTSSVILYATATTTPQFNQQPVSVDTQDDLSQYNYDHKDKQTIARENQFNLEGKNTAIRRKKKNPRMYTDSFAITCWSNVTNGNYVEFDTFRSKGTHSDPNCSSTPINPFLDVSNRSIRKIIVRAQAEERRKRTDEIADKVLCIAETSVSRAMEEIRKILPYEFMQHSDKLLQIFQLCQQTIPRTATTHTDAVVSAWLRDYFRHPKRPKCLVIIGPTSTGKTSFPLSLPGRVCYFKGRLCLNTWSDDARYLVFDDIPWDEFENRNFPSKKDLLSANGAVAVTDKYQPTVTINVIMPSIVLLNPGDEGSLTAIPVTEQEQRQAKYWTKRAVVY
ncbi:unnamed protein product [Rotaria socialis]|uniref:Geminivirus AL1 replication-associated protein central domain-containing protein n=1 Tax=Rotaria socialis TaxID=392032 RepID=A0A818HUD9_9BILA|nr:unnamed protein product [Rotaria socialis]